MKPCCRSPALPRLKDWASSVTLDRGSRHGTLSPMSRPARMGRSMPSLFIMLIRVVRLDLAGPPHRPGRRPPSRPLRARRGSARARNHADLVEEDGAARDQLLLSLTDGWRSRTASDWSAFRLRLAAELCLGLEPVAFGVARQAQGLSLLVDRAGGADGFDRSVRRRSPPRPPHPETGGVVATTLRFLAISSLLSIPLHRLKALHLASPDHGVSVTGRSTHPFEPQCKPRRTRDEGAGLGRELGEPLHAAPVGMVHLGQVENDRAA